MKKQKEITEQQYRDAVETVLAYRAQVTEHSKKINAEVTELNPNAKRAWGNKMDFSHCTAETPLMRSRISHRLYNILTRNKLRNTAAFKDGTAPLSEAYLNIHGETPLKELAKISVTDMGMQRNFGVKCMNELEAICAHLKIKMQP